MATRQKQLVPSAAPNRGIASDNPFSAFVDSSDDDSTASGAAPPTGTAAAAKNSSATTAPTTGDVQTAAQKPAMRPQQRQKIRKQQQQSQQVMSPQDSNTRPARDTGRYDRDANYDAYADHNQGSNQRSYRRDYDNSYNSNAYQNGNTGGTAGNRDDQAFGSGEDFGRGLNRSQRGRGARGRGRGGRGGAGGAGGAGGTGPGTRREFDRHVSGTDRPRGMKREGQGKYNWGNQGDDPQTHEAPVNQESQGGDWAPFDFGDGAAAASPGDPTHENIDPTHDENKQTDGVAAAVRDEPEVQYYEDYLRERASKRSQMKEHNSHVISTDIRNKVSLQELENEGYTQHVKDVGESPKRKDAGRGFRRMQEPRSHEVPSDSFGGGRDRRTAFGERSSRGRDKPVVEKQLPKTRKVSNLNFSDCGAFPSLE